MVRSILMPVRTVAEWGGVHEWTVDAASAFIRAGHQVSFIGAGKLFRERALATGANFTEVDWSDVSAATEVVLDSMRGTPGDLVFSHAPQARMLGLDVARELNAEHFVMVHGAYHDQMYSWADHVDGFLAASPSLVHYVQRFGRVPPWMVALVPNAAADHVFDMPRRSFEEKTAGGVARIVTASRLAKDKLAQIPIVVEALSICARVRPDLHWKVDILGDGPLRDSFELRYRQAFQGRSNVSYEFHGWAPPTEIPLRMNNAVLGIVSGMGGVRTIASGTLCIGVGARNFVGLQYGRNLRAGVWSNFGDHGTMRFRPTALSGDLIAHLSPDVYDAAVQTARDALRRTNSQSVVDGMMLSALQC